jgi:hypothetical protein
MEIKKNVTMGYKNNTVHHTVVNGEGWSQDKTANEGSHIFKS